MRYVDGELRHSATDLVNHLACRHLTGLARETAEGRADRSWGAGGGGHDLIARFGDEHEARCLDQLHERGMNIAEIETGRTWPDVERAATETIEAMRSGVDAVFQATFIDGAWSGHADFLMRVPAATDLGNWGYEPVDAKLARSAKVRAMLQLGEYAAQVARVQGTAPENVHLWLGSNERFTFPTADLAAFHRRSRNRLLEDLGLDLLAVYPSPCAHCGICRWSTKCDTRRRDDDHLSFVAGIRADQIDRLEAAGITTLEALAGANAQNCPEGVTARGFEQVRAQARLQFEARDGTHRYELLDPTERPESGFHRLPEPSEHDLFFDLEGNPFREEGGIEYLWGISTRGDEYHEWWAHNPAEEKRVFEEVVDHMIKTRQRHPEAHIYHYAHHEVTTLKRLMGQYATRESEVDELLRGGALVDLYAVVRGAVRCSTEGYSLKDMERFYHSADGREGPVKSGFESIVMYERWCDGGSDTLLREIADYNKEDCVSTRELDDWLEARRDEALPRFGPIDRPQPLEGKAAEALDAYEERVVALRTQLLQDVDVASTGPSVPTDSDDNAAVPATGFDWLPHVGESPGSEMQADDRALWLLAHLLDFHRREEKSDWWAHFARLDMDEDELFEDSDAISGLAYEGIVDTVKRSNVHRFTFDPDQPYKLKPGGNPPIDPRTGESAGTIHRVDPVEGIIELTRGKNSAKPLPDALIPAKPVPNPNAKEALEEVGNDIVAHGLDGTRFGSVADLLRRGSPRLATGSLADLSDLDAGERVVEAGTRLQDSSLPIQGPPGAGKTYNAARLISRLAAEGKRVAVCANSHRVIENLLTAARKADSSLRILKAGGDDPEIADVDHESNTEARAMALTGDHDVIGGTVWLFAHPELRQAFDILIIDEAGQYGLANTIAAATCALSLVLVGDPQQLDQPTKGSHPPGVDRSALAHVIGTDQTIDTERGIFLDSTHRLHPDICSFVSETSYDGRLQPHQKCSCRSIAGVDHGLRWHAVEHAGNRSRSREEAAVVREVVDDMLGREFIDHDGTTRPIGVDDVLVITPYNAQVRELRAALPDGVLAGTVDLFQGREAPVVIYSMASSSAADAPRGLGFLLDQRRFNVAVSRAQRLAVVVASPEVLDALPSSVGQISLVSTVCRYVEVASA
ncbi:MAG: TM0106 family RecB-like putative nuclease [Acidimicrobiales bacterium]|nr:TM0106 family RecB-like putative nuclease [Acidimicrobiales bacterium]